MTEKKAPDAGEEYPPGSPEDVKLMLQLLSQFFTNKIRAIELYARTGQMELQASTGSTKSFCHIDGKDDGDDKQPDV